MKISYDEQQKRALALSIKYKDTKSEKSYSQSFLRDFMDVFGIDTHDHGKLEQHLNRENTDDKDDEGGFMDYFLQDKIIIEQKSRGEDLKKALDQAEKYHYSLKSELTPDRIMICDFEHFLLVNKNKNNEKHEFDLNKLHENIHLFKFFNEVIDEEIGNEVDVSRKASDIMGTIYTRLQENNYKKEDTEKMLIRLVYCLFAEDTGIFLKDSFRNYIKDLELKYVGTQISLLFDVLNTSPENREKTLEDSLKNFPYINGSLFKASVQSPSFSKDMYESLLKATDFNWSGISPAIFGTLFQTVMDETSRREEGAHFTSEENILKVIKPLFLDDLYDEFEKIKTTANRKKALEIFHKKISKLKFLDPACGAGNFLIITYKQLRKLELKILDEMGMIDQVLDLSSLIKVNVNQFYGIEKNKFSASIAGIALWMMDHVMNIKVSEKYGQSFIRIPLIDHPTIINNDALEFDWNKVLPSSECSYILGNPPFGGSNSITNYQREQTLKITSSKKLDYVSNWFIKASQYINEYIPHTHTHTHTHIKSKLVLLQLIV